MTDKLLDCGHEPSPHGAHTTGTAHTPDGKEICWSCADDSQQRDLLTYDDVFLYLTKAEPDGRTYPYILTTWPGGRMMRVTRFSVQAIAVPNVWYPVKRWYLRAVDSWDQEWYGTSPGPGMYARMHKTAASKRKERTVTGTVK